jgi:hypothetical protein
MAQVRHDDNAALRASILACPTIAIRVELSWKQNRFRGPGCITLLGIVLLSLPRYPNCHSVTLSTHASRQSRKPEGLMDIALQDPDHGKITPPYPPQAVEDGECPEPVSLEQPGCSSCNTARQKLSDVFTRKASERSGRHHKCLLVVRIHSIPLLDSDVRLRADCRKTHT